MNYDDIPCRVSLDTEEYHREYYEKPQELIDICCEIVEILDNQELSLYDEEIVELEREMDRMKERVANSTKKW